MKIRIGNATSHSKPTAFTLVEIALCLAIIGFALVAMLMLFATWNDLVHLGASFMARGT